MPNPFNGHDGLDGDHKREAGIALLVATFVLMLIGAIAVAAIGHSGQESNAAARSRAATRSIHAADAGIQLAMNRVRQNPPRTDAVDIVVDGRTVQSRRRTVAGAQPIVEAGTGAPPEGYAVNVGAGYVNELFLAPVTSTSPDGAVSEIEAKLARLSVSGGSY